MLTLPFRTVRRPLWVDVTQAAVQNVSREFQLLSHEDRRPRSHWSRDCRRSCHYRQQRRDREELRGSMLLSLNLLSTILDYSRLGFPPTRSVWAVADGLRALSLDKCLLTCVGPLTIPFEACLPLYLRGGRMVVPNIGY